jgi:3-keto-disaccharide hydrolase
MIKTNVVIAAAAIVAAGVGALGAQQQNPYVGRWNITGTGENSNYVYWLEVKEDGGKLSGMLLNRGGHPLPLPVIKIENGELIFQPDGGQRGPGPEFHLRAQGDKMTGSVKLGERTVDLAGARPPKWGKYDANAPHKFGKPVELFDGKSMDAWDVQIKDRPIKWVVEDGAMTNTPPQANNLVSKQKFQDFKIHAEYKLDQRGVSRSGQPVKGNSGIYLRGRYELQVLDDFGDKPFERGHMSVYGWHTPTTNASKPAGEWQTMEATVVGNRVTVFLNGQKVQDNVTLEAITGGALDANESEPGPIVLQGDHEKVWYRKVTVTPITDPRK